MGTGMQMVTSTGFAQIPQTTTIPQMTLPMPSIAQAYAAAKRELAPPVPSKPAKRKKQKHHESESSSEDDEEPSSSSSSSSSEEDRKKSKKRKKKKKKKKRKKKQKKAHSVEADISERDEILEEVERIKSSTEEEAEMRRKSAASSNVSRNDISLINKLRGHRGEKEDSTGEEGEIRDDSPAAPTRQAIKINLARSGSKGPALGSTTTGRTFEQPSNFQPVKNTIHYPPSSLRGPSEEKAVAAVQAAAVAATMAIKKEKHVAVRSRSKSSGPQQQKVPSPPPRPPSPMAIKQEKRKTPELTFGRQEYNKGERSPSREREDRDGRSNRIVIYPGSKRSRSRSYSRSRSRSRGRSYRSRDRSRSRSPRDSSPYRSHDEYPLRDPHFCDDCRVPFNDDNAYDHFSSRNHHERVRFKIRCYLCSRYVNNTKDHLEQCHVSDVFQCRGSNCHHPKFLDLMKILKHIWERHPSVAGNDPNPDELIRSGMISIPTNLSSYKCKLCSKAFVGQSLTNVLQHQRWEDGIREPSEADVAFFCRICGLKRGFEDNISLQEHIRDHGYTRTRTSRSPSRLE